ncbi:MAG: DHA2 family efflux MFS transporter permease subunit [Actinobacteria bacterium]|nr:DHA2 family efflux MFS transporter permease subunit [Actinomycetota bacterium]
MSDKTTSAPAGAASKASPGAVLAVTCAAAFIAFLDVTIVNTAFPDIERDFAGHSLSELSWIINAYTIVFAAMLLPAGRIGDLAGRKRMFIAGIAIFTLASAACAAAPSLGLLIAARAIQGAGAALMIPTSLALMLPAFPPERRSLAIGIWGASNSVAAAVGPALGGSLVELADWRLVFLINVPLGATALLAATRVLTEYRVPGANRLPDLAGTVALTAGIGLVVLGIVQGNEWEWTSLATLGSLAAGAALCAYTLWRSAGHPVPAIETSLWKVPGFAGVNVGSFTSGVAFFAFMLGGTLFLTSIWRYSVLEAGLAMSTGALSSAVFAPLGGALMGRFGERIIAFIGGLVFAASCFWMAAMAGPTPDFLGVWLPGGILVGWGIGFVFPALAGAAVKNLPQERMGAGIALNMTARQTGGAVGVAMLVALLTKGGLPYDRFIESWWICGAVAAVTGVLALWLVPAGAGGHVAATSTGNAIRAGGGSGQAMAGTTTEGIIAVPEPSRTISSLGSKS